MNMVDSYFNFISEYIRLMKKKYDVAEDYCNPRERLFMEYDYLTGSDDPIYYIGGGEKPQDIYSDNELKSMIREKGYEMKELDNEYYSKLQEVQDEIENLYDDYIKQLMTNNPFECISEEEIEEYYLKLKENFKYDSKMKLVIKDSVYEKMSMSDEEVIKFFENYPTHILESYEDSLRSIQHIESEFETNEHNFIGEDVVELYRNCSIYNLYPEV